MTRKNDAKGAAPEVQVVIFRLRDEEFGVNILDVREIVRMMHITHMPEAPGFIEGIINLRGQVIAVIDLAKQFGLPPLKELPKTARIVVVDVHDETVGLIVEEVPEVLKITEDSIETTPELIETEIKEHYIKGVAKLGERLLILLNLEEVLKPHQIAEAAAKITKNV